MSGGNTTVADRIVKRRRSLVEKNRMREEVLRKLKDTTTTRPVEAAQRSSGCSIIR